LADAAIEYLAKQRDEEDKPETAFPGSSRCTAEEHDSPKKTLKKSYIIIIIFPLIFSFEKSQPNF
jgi:hypothetical protein